MRPRHLREYNDDDYRPRMRLRRMSAKHTRIIEILRYLYEHNSSSRLDDPRLYLELARRGVLSPAEHIIRDQGGAIPTTNAVFVVQANINDAIDLGLVKRAYPDTKNRNAKHVYDLTMDGKETLLDWDDPTTDGIW